MSLDAVFTVAAIWLAILVFACMLLLLRARTPARRIIALDALVLVLVGLLVLHSAAEGVHYFLDAALMLAVLGFVATIAAARYYGDEELFR